MGLFDEVSVQARNKMPDGAPTDVLYQTKDFEEPYMERYTITADGRLIREPRWWRKDQPDEVAEDMNWHGYLSLLSYNSQTKKTVDLVAKFTDGNLVEITVSQD